jgi:hypothetical protein
VRPGHFWLLKFGKVPGSNSCVEKKFKLGTRKYEEYKGVRFGNGDCASGLTFEEWDPSADTDASEAPVARIVNSSELRAAGFDLREVLPLQLEAAARGARRTRGAKKKILVWCDDPPEDPVISIFAGCLANHDRAHSPH